MIQPDDEQSLLRMLRVDTLPERVKAECIRWTRWYHSDGHSGRLGTLALITLLRSLGYSPAEPAKQLTPHSAALAYGTRIEANFFGGWVPGEFLGLGPGGLSVVKLDNDGVVRECHAHVIRLPGTDRLSVKAETAPEAVDPGPPGEVLPAFDWSQAPAGTPVWVDDGDVAEGVLVAYHGDTITCRLNSDDTARDFPASAVNYAGA